MGKWLAEDTTALWCDHSTSYTVLLLLLYGRMFDLHRNGIYAMLSEGENNNQGGVFHNEIFIITSPRVVPLARCEKKCENKHLCDSIFPRY